MNIVKESINDKCTGWNFYLDQIAANKFEVYASTDYAITHMHARSKEFSDLGEAQEYYKQELAYYGH